MALGIYFLPLDLATKGFMIMATMMIIQSSITVTKTMRDNQEATKIVTKFEDAKTEHLLMAIGNRAAQPELTHQGNPTCRVALAVCRSTQQH